MDDETLEPLSSYIAVVESWEPGPPTRVIEDYILVFGTDLDDAFENARREYGDRLVEVRLNIDRLGGRLRGGLHHCPPRTGAHRL